MIFQDFERTLEVKVLPCFEMLRSGDVGELQICRHLCAFSNCLRLECVAKEKYLNCEPQQSVHNGCDQCQAI